MPLLFLVSCSDPAWTLPQALGKRDGTIGSAAWAIFASPSVQAPAR